MARMAGKIVLISGGARGQGAAEARLVVAEGGKVVIGDVLEAEGRRLAGELGAAAVFVRQDVTAEADWAAAVEAARGARRTARPGQQRGHLMSRARCLRPTPRCSSGTCASTSSDAFLA